MHHRGSFVSYGLAAEPVGSAPVSTIVYISFIASLGVIVPIASEFQLLVYALKICFFTAGATQLAANIAEAFPSGRRIKTRPSLATVSVVPNFH